MTRERNEESLNHRDVLLYAIGASEEDTKRPVTELVNSWNEINPGHFPFKDVVTEVKEEIYKADGPALELPVTGICDGIRSNIPGNRYTPPARGLVSSEAEMVAKPNMLKDMAIMSACDKVVPGMIMGALRVGIPNVMLIGSSMTVGHTEGGKMLTLAHIKQAYAAYIAGDIDHDYYEMVVHNVCPTPGTCPFMGIADTMHALAGILSPSPHGNASVHSQTSGWRGMARSAVRRLMQVVRDNIRPQGLITQESPESATHYMMVTGGPINSLLHTPVIARQAGCETSPETLDRISREVPVISAVYLSHLTYTMEGFSAADGLGTVVGELAKTGKINAECGGMFGIVDEEAELAHDNNTDVTRPVGEPIHRQGGFTVLHGNIGSGSVIVKFSAVDPEVWKSSDPAKYYDPQDDAWSAVFRDEIIPDGVVVTYYEGPKGSPGMLHTETFATAVLGKGTGKKIAFVSDRRFSGATDGLAIGYVSPEAYEGGNLALIENGDVIHIGIEGCILIIDVSNEEFDCRRVSWKPVEKSTIGWLNLYRRNYIPAHKGATVYQKK